MGRSLTISTRAGGVVGNESGNQSESGGSIPSPRFALVPITQRAAKEYVTAVHRHHRAPVGSIFQIGLKSGDDLIGCVMVGRPVARMLQDGYTAEVNRLCTDGSRNACSMLYGAARRAAKALGYRLLITYTLPEEGGASLKASGWTCVGEAGGGSHNRPSRPRTDSHPLGVKWRWEVRL